MAALARELADIVRDRHWPWTIEPPWFVRKLSSALACILNLLQMQEDIPSLPGGFFFRYVSVGSLLITELLGAIKMRDDHFVADKKSTGEGERILQELEGLQRDLHTWVRKTAEWLLGSPVCLQDSFLRTLQAALEDAAEVNEETRQQALHLVVEALGRVRPVMLELQENPETEIPPRVSFVATGTTQQVPNGSTQIG